MRYVVYTQIHTEDGIERWFYDLCDTHEEANEVAYQAGGKWPRYHCLCRLDEAKAYGIQDMPLGLQ